jgi:peptide/nickel transport system substrate-binding protein
MLQRRSFLRRPDRIRKAVVTAGLSAAVIVAGSCHGRAGSPDAGSATELRVGVGQVSTTNPTIGVRQLSQLLSVESLARPGEDARMQPWLAERWSRADDNRSIQLKLRTGITFHDGTRLDAYTLAMLFPEVLKNFMGSIADDLDYVTAVDDMTVEIAFRKPSPFLIESLEAPIQRSASISTGPFKVESGTAANLRANTDYYLGPPTISRVHVQSFPSVRSAWAELLRGRIDVLYEVGTDALASMENATNVSVFKFTRRYQHAILLNSDAAALRSRSVRRALNASIDREKVLQDALNGQGIPSSGPIWPRHWASRNDRPTLGFRLEEAAKILALKPSPKSSTSGQIRFSCLVPPDTINERLALEVKRQLELVGVTMALEQASQDEITQRIATRRYEAALLEVISGPTLFRPYYFWHSDAPANSGGWGNSAIDTALDRVRYAATDNDYRQSVEAIQQAFVDDPPAIFLAWSVRARAVSNRFSVPPPESGREIMSNLRLWKPVDAEKEAIQN